MAELGRVLFRNCAFVLGVSALAFAVAYGTGIASREFGCWVAVTFAVSLAMALLLASAIVEARHG